MKEIIIETNDSNLISELRKFNKIGFIEIYEPMEMAKKLSDIKKPIIQITIKIIGALALGIVANGIYDYCKNDPEHNTIINNYNITNKLTVEKLMMIIDNSKNSK